MPDTETKTPTHEEVLHKAFDVAYFIHRNKRIALNVVGKAVESAKVRCRKQGKRLDYVPVGRRSKVSLDEAQTVQLHVHIESDAYETLQEELYPATLDDEDMIVRYVKQIVRLTMPHNSFHVTLGVARFLHAYTTAEVMALHDVVSQDPDRGGDDAHWRRLKSELMKKLQERFGEALSVRKDKHHELHFVPRADSVRFAELVRSFLKRCVPWGTSCVALPPGFDPLRDAIPRFANSPAPDDPKWDRIELDRMHMILDPDCFAPLLASLGYAPPEHRLHVPHIKLQSGGSSDDDRRRPPTLDDEDLNRLVSAGNRQAHLRGTAAGVFSIRVDGRERARFDPTLEHRARLTVESDADYLEIGIGEGDERTVLASHVFSRKFGDAPEAGEWSIRIEGGREFRISAAPTTDGDLGIDIGYRETRPIRAAALAWRRLMNRSSANAAGPVGYRPALGWSAAVVLVGLFGLTVFLFLNVPTESPRIAMNPPPPPPPPAGSNPPAPVETVPTRPSVPPRQSDGTRISDPVLRSLNGNKGTSALKSVKALCVEFGGGEFEQRLGEAVAARLEADERFVRADGPSDDDGKISLVPDRDHADTLMEATLDQGKRTVTVRCVNIEGKILWRTRHRLTGEPSPETASETARRIVSAFLKNLPAPASRRTGRYHPR